MIALSGHLKGFILIAAILPGTAAYNPPTGRPNVSICSVALPFIVDRVFYRAKTRQELRELGELGDPVGLYFLAQQDLEASLRTEAILKLERAASAGLGSAYDRLAVLYDDRGDRRAASVARHCSARLQMMTLSQP